jgi:hypothetical protein
MIAFARSKRGHQSGAVVHACNPGYSADGDRRIENLRTARKKLVRPYLKNKI